MCPDGNPRSHRVARLLALVGGITGLVLCLLVPLLPVRQTTATISWPQGTTAAGNVSQITAPLVSGAPHALDISIPCAAIATLPAKGGMVVSTLPADGFQTGKYGLFVRADTNAVVVAFRDTVAAAAPRSAIAEANCRALHIWTDIAGAHADFIGIPGAAGSLPPEKKPQVGGIFTDLKVPPQAGLSAKVDIDTRFILAPTALKRLAMILGVLAVALAIGALAVLDRLSRGGSVRDWRSRVAWLARYRPSVPSSPRLPRGPRTRLVDTGVIGALLLWHIVGATTSDDGYNLTIARVAPNAGYVTNYYRYFGTTEAPFDWYLSVLAKMADVSTAGVWMRLPATLAGIACWLIISRFALRRLGPGKGGLAGDSVAVWTAAAVFVAAWLPFDNGLRPEPLIALGVLATWMMVERSIALARLMPAAVAIVIAVLAVTLAPQGLIAVAPLLTGARAIAGIIRRRQATDGLVAPLAVLAAAFSLIAVVVCRSQSLATVAESARIKYKVGPTIAWYQDFLRYYFLTVEDNPDGSMARRFAVLVLLLCMFGMLFVLLRKGRVAGLAGGPAWRLIGSTAIGLLLLTFTPTKWAIQFGAFAGLAGVLGGVTAFTVARIGLHSRRNLALYITALLFVLAWATSGINGWFYVGNYGVPWFDIQPVIAGYRVMWMFLTLSIFTGLLAAWYHFRMDYAGHTEVKDNRRNRILASAPLLAVAAIMVFGEVSSLAKGVVMRYPHYTTGKANLRAIASGLSPASCAMADDVLAEADSNAGMLQPVPGQKFGPAGPLGGSAPVGLTPAGVGKDLKSDPVVAKPGVVNSDASPDKPNVAITDSAGTAGGTGPIGVNGSNAALPFGLDPARTPVMGSYGQNDLTAEATSAWYRLPEDWQHHTDSHPLVVISAAGAIWSFDEDGEVVYGQALRLQWGTRKPDGSVTELDQMFPIDLGPAPAWRNLRFPFADVPAEANVTRIVAVDPNLSPEQWLAFTPPRVPELESLQQLIGSRRPVLADIATAANFPCQRPFSEHLGIAELPDYRILPDHKQTAVSSNLWQSSGTGGPFMFTQGLMSTSTVPTYLSGDWYRDWGSVEKYHRLVPADQAPEAVVAQGVTTVHGWSRPGPIRALP
ncbi:arabinosyltransferase domain-containing protein [Mycobacterium sp.]|uniref:arabinosyltransferase domain-containing protein n=1 Tax=Mycobacterium sp. TaxID=1785 RepID=UPI003A866DD0